MTGSDEYVQEQVHFMGIGQTDNFSAPLSISVYMYMCMCMCVCVCVCAF